MTQQFNSRFICVLTALMLGGILFYFPIEQVTCQQLPPSEMIAVHAESPIESEVRLPGLKMIQIRFPDVTTTSKIDVYVRPLRSGIYMEERCIELVLYGKRNGFWLPYFRIDLTQDEFHELITIPWEQEWEEGEWFLFIWNQMEKEIVLDIKVSHKPEGFLSSAKDFLSSAIFNIVIRILIIILFMVLVIRRITLPSQYNFQFHIPMDQPLQDVYNRVKNIITQQSKIKEETPHRSFTYQTLLSKGTIRLIGEWDQTLEEKGAVLEEQRILVSGTVKWGLGSFAWLLLICYLAFYGILYGFMGSLLMLPLVLPFYLLLDFRAYRKRKSMGNLLCKELNGVQFNMNIRGVSAGEFLSERRS